MKSVIRFQAGSASTTNNPNLVVVEPGLYCPLSNTFNGRLIITLDNGFEVEVPSLDLAHPLHGIDPNGCAFCRVVCRRSISFIRRRAGYRGAGESVPLSGLLPLLFPFPLMTFSSRYFLIR